MKKRILGLLLFSAMLLSACGKGAGNITSTPVPSPTEGVHIELPDWTKPTDTEKVELTMRDYTIISDKPFLKADGKVLKDDYGKGNLVQLRGTNAGGYLLQEFWMCVTGSSTNVKDQNSLIDTLIERFGQEKADALIKQYEDTYWTIADFDYCASLGINCIRLPFWWRNFTDSEGNFIENPFERIDWFVEEAGKRGIYVILDMHGAYGSQNGSDHSGIDGGDHKMEASEFFFGENAEKNQQLYYVLWEKIAEHFNGNPWVAGYDLLNEPYCTYRYNTGKPDKEILNMLWDIYDEAYTRIRAIDPDHVIIMEATWNPSDLPKPSTYGWENVMYEYHNYLYDDYSNAKGQQISNMQSKLNSIKNANYNVPSLLGEFSLFNSLTAWEKGVKLIDDSGISWTTWTYKVVSDYGNWGIKNETNNSVNVETADYDTIMAVWTRTGKDHNNTGLVKVLEQFYKREFIAK